MASFKKSFCTFFFLFVFTAIGYAEGSLDEYTHVYVDQAKGINNSSITGGRKFSAPTAIFCSNPEGAEYIRH